MMKRLSIILMIVILLNPYLLKAEEYEWDTLLKCTGLGMMVLGMYKIFQSEDILPINVATANNNGQAGKVTIINLDLKSNTAKGTILLGFGLFAFIKGYKLSCRTN
jgi:hypothetical protein